MIGKNHLCAGMTIVGETTGITVSTCSNPRERHPRRIHGQRPALPWWWGRPVFGLWAAYSVAASHLDQDSALACAVQRFVPITAAGQRSIRTSFPFNRPPRGGLTCTRPFLHSHLESSLTQHLPHGCANDAAKPEDEVFVHPVRLVHEPPLPQDIHKGWGCISPWP